MTNASNQNGRLKTRADLFSLRKKSHVPGRDIASNGHLMKGGGDHPKSMSHLNALDGTSGRCKWGGEGGGEKGGSKRKQAR